MLNRRYVKALRTATLGILATAALIWGAVDIVGVSADALLEYVWLSIKVWFLLSSQHFLLHCYFGFFVDADNLKARALNAVN